MIVAVAAHYDERGFRSSSRVERVALYFEWKRPLSMERRLRSCLIVLIQTWKFLVNEPESSRDARNLRVGEQIVVKFQPRQIKKRSHKTRNTSHLTPKGTKGIYKL